MGISRENLHQSLNQFLNSAEFQDYGPNGLQIEGKEIIQKIAFAVSATRDSINEAIKKHADALIVHHGLFWSFHGVRTITGSFSKRISPLITHQMNLLAYHLPLDAHIEIGNAACVAKLMGLNEIEPFGNYKGSPTGVKGIFPGKKSARDISQQLKELLNHNIIFSSPKNENKNTITSMGIITGGANSSWLEASKQGLDSFLTGEMSEHDWNESQEEGIFMFAGGHHATERFGIQALMEWTQQQFEVECFFIDSKNPA